MNLSCISALANKLFNSRSLIAKSVFLFTMSNFELENGAGVQKMTNIKYDTLQAFSVFVKPHILQLCQKGTAKMKSRALKIKGTSLL